MVLNCTQILDGHTRLRSGLWRTDTRIMRYTARLRLDPRDQILQCLRSARMHLIFANSITTALPSLNYIFSSGCR